jgi:hypothetical protein
VTPPKAKQSPAKAGPGSDDRFVYESPLGAIEVPSLAKINSGVIRRIRKLGAVDQIFTVLEELASPESLALVDQLAADDFNTFVAAWQAHSGVGLGE